MAGLGVDCAHDKYHNIIYLCKRERRRLIKRPIGHCKHPSNVVIVPAYWTRMIMCTDFRFSNQTISPIRLWALLGRRNNNNNINTCISINIYIHTNIYDIKQIRFMRQRLPQKTSYSRRRTDCQWSIRQGVPSNETWLYVNDVRSWTR